MKVHFGSNRVAVIGNRLTVKIAKIRHKQALGDILALIRDPHPILIRHYFLSMDNTFANFTNVFLQGFIENLVEAKYSKQLGDVAVPTRFSFLGVLNVQETAQEHELDGEQIMRALWKAAGKEFGPVHTFMNGKNYGIHEGRLKFLDYGSKKAVLKMLEHLQTMRTGLDEALMSSTPAK